MHLAQSKVGAIKIDRSIVSGIADDENCRSTVAATLAMADKIQVDVIGVGVETQPQFDALQALGCRYAQGFLLAQPMMADVATDYLSAAFAERGRANGV